LATAKVVGTVMEVAGAGTPVAGVGFLINAGATLLDEARQVKFEDKSVEDATFDGAVNVAN
jgi:hypothetical protein